MEVIRLFHPIWHSLKLSIVCTWATQHELQNNLQVTAACAGLGGTQERPSCEPSLAAARVGLGLGSLSKQYGASAGQMLLV